MVLVFGSLLEWAGGSFPDLLVLRLVVVPRSYFGIGGGGDGALKDFFPTLYSTALIKSAAVVDYLCWNMGSIHGDVTFCNGCPQLGVGNAN